MFTISPRVLRRASRDLIRHGLAVDDESQIPLPDAGRSNLATREGLGRLLAETADTADGMRHLGDALDAFVSSTTALDGRVGDLLDLLRHAELS